MKTTAILGIAGLGTLGGGITDMGFLAVAVVLVVAIVAVYLMLLRGIAPHIEWKSFKFGFRRLPGGPKKPDG